LIFQLHTHTSLYDGKDIRESIYYPNIHPKQKKSKAAMTSSAAHTTAHTYLSQGNDEEAGCEEEEAEEKPQLSFPVTVVLLVIVAAVRAHVFLIRGRR
jgi:hypothetical protein